MNGNTRVVGIQGNGDERRSRDWGLMGDEEEEMSKGTNEDGPQKEIRKET